MPCMLLKYISLEVCQSKQEALLLMQGKLQTSLGQMGTATV